MDEMLAREEGLSFFSQSDRMVGLYLIDCKEVAPPDILLTRKAEGRVQGQGRIRELLISRSLRFEV